MWLTGVLLMGFVGIQSSHGQGNLLVNGGFEDGVVDPWGIHGGSSMEVVNRLVGAAVPERTPGAITSRLSGPSGSQAASHSSSRIRAERPRPPSNFQASGNASMLAVCFVMSTRIIRSPV